MLQVYAVTKLANIWFSTELARRLQGSGVSVFSVHPGAVYTDLGRNLGGGQTTCHYNVIVGDILSAGPRVCGLPGVQTELPGDPLPRAGGQVTGDHTVIIIITHYSGPASSVPWSLTWRPANTGTTAGDELIM